MLALLSAAVGVGGLWVAASGLVMLVGSVGLAAWCWSSIGEGGERKGGKPQL